MSIDLDKLNEALQKDIDLDKRKKDVFEKDLTLRENRVNRELNELIKNTAELEQAKNISFAQITPEGIQELVDNNEDYMEAARNSMTFINKEFKTIVPYFKKNLILIGGDTGDGKSTLCANLAFSTISQKDPITKSPCKCLIISNEEDPSDYYCRIISIIKKWKYTNHDQFTNEQRKVFKEYIPILAKDGRLTIIGDVYQGVPGFSTTVEGIESILDNLIKQYEETGIAPYHSVIIDYYQNIRFSKVDPKMDEYNCQRKLAAILDRYKLRVPFPIVVLAQMKKLVDDDDSTPFNVRLRGSKLICDKATFICELIPERDLLRSKWKVHKSRFTDAVGQSIYTGYDNGKFVPYSLEFIKNVAKYVERNLEKSKAQELGMLDTNNDDDIVT